MGGVSRHTAAAGISAREAGGDNATAGNAALTDLALTPNNGNGV
jgi:hypothetical protein